MNTHAKETVCGASKATQITVASANLNEHIGALEQMMIVLEKRLHPVIILQSQDVVEDEYPKSEVGLVPLAQEIVLASWRLEIVTDQLESILRRIQL